MTDPLLLNLKMAVQLQEGSVSLTGRRRKLSSSRSRMGNQFGVFEGGTLLQPR